MKIKKIFVSLVTLILITGNLFPMIMGNDTCEAFTPNPCKNDGDKTNEGLSLGWLLIEGAGHFLQSNSDFQFFLKKIELSENYMINYYELSSSINSTIESMMNAKKVYNSIIETSERYEYNPIVIDKLKNFDYCGYMEEKNLIPSIFNEVKECLSIGDVRGFYKRMYYKMVSILDMLDKVKQEVDLKIFPDISHLWRINQSISEAEIFGQYAAEIFINLKK